MTSTSPRRTRQRQAIAEYLAMTDGFRSAQQIHQGLLQGGTAVSLPTVYRALGVMATAGEIDQVISEGQSSYRQCSSHHHHHLRCRTCGHTIELVNDPVEQWIDDISSDYGFACVTHLTEITGVCPACQGTPSTVDRTIKEL
ncbi:MAG: transcriptional repressor [Propionibacteriaceae bacterium]|nr:transcriptional repressor [Propionibacteriaceae bacterium]